MARQVNWGSAPAHFNDLGAPFDGHAGCQEVAIKLSPLTGFIVMIAADQQRFRDAVAASKARASSFIASIPQDLAKREDLIGEEVLRENSSAKSKLGKLYRLVEELGEAAKPFIACGKGCSACCRMNVTISSMEAERLAQFSKKRINRVDHHIHHDPTRFAGVACPFLVENACSVYAIRPYACRAHVSFDTTAYWCEPERAYEEGMGMVSFDGAKSAYLAVLAKVPDSRFADIRDFFPG